MYIANRNQTTRTVGVDFSTLFGLHLMLSRFTRERECVCARWRERERERVCLYDVEDITMRQPFNVLRSPPIGSSVYPRKSSYVGDYSLQFHILMRIVHCAPLNLRDFYLCYMPRLQSISALCPISPNIVASLLALAWIHCINKSTSPPRNRIGGRRCAFGI